MRIPFWTLLLCGIATLVFLVPSLGAAAIYDRNLISGGAWWRLFTGNLAHLSALHLAYDVVALLVIGSIIELRGDRSVWLLYCTAGAAIGLAVYMTCPELRFYGGLSGIVSAALVYLCMDGLRDADGWRWVCRLALVLVTIKIGIEFMLGTSLLASATHQPFVPVPVSHLAGACSALLVFALTRHAHGGRSVYGSAASI